MYILSAKNVWNWVENFLRCKKSGFIGWNLHEVFEGLTKVFNKLVERFWIHGEGPTYGGLTFPWGLRPQGDPWKKKSCTYVYPFTFIIYKKICFEMVPGVDVMITIFCDFRQFSCEKIGVFSKKTPMLWSIFSQLSFVFSQKRPFLCRLFLAKIFKNHNIGPRNKTLPTNAEKASC
jgi:hypothetical protein